MTLVSLSDDQVEQIARRVVALLREESELVDAETLGRLLGRSRAWVYDHATELGAIPLGPRGAGRRPRLAFDPHAARERLMRLSDGGGTTAPLDSRRRPTSVALLPIGSGR